MPDPRRRVLILGGTSEARLLADLLADQAEVVLSLAGRTAAPVPAKGERRVGGFGGVDGLIAYLKTEHIAVLVDATHPFAATMSHHAREAAAACGVPRLTLRRPDWTPGADDRWIDVPDHAAAAAALPALGWRVWLTFGDGLSAYAAVADTWFLVRRIEAQAAPLPLPRCTLILGRGPFTVAGERALIARHRIDVIVSKSSGGDSTSAKLAAARECALPVVMIRRPPPEPGAVVETPTTAAAWVIAALDGPSRSTA